MSSSGKLAQIASRLRRTYGPSQPQRRWDNPLDALIHSLLSQSGTATTCERAYANLRRRFRTWEAVRGAPLKDVVAAIRAGGLANIKAVHIKALLEEIWREQRHFDLSFLRDVSDEEVRAYLGRFRGVSRMMTACVLLFGLGRAAFPVDADVLRVCRRLGLLNGQRMPEKAEAVLAPLIRSRDSQAFHGHLVEHGRAVCTAHHPGCDRCALTELCDFARRSPVLATTARRARPLAE
jgi:endonuclease III